jgi:NTE family protein
MFLRPVPRIQIWFYLFALLPLSGNPALAQDVPVGAERPRIGLVLGGGGAKGAAHIGVLRVLDEMRIPINCVAGTSMGALVGATFASGKAADEIEREVLAIDWTRTVGGQGRRDNRPIEVKLEELAYSNPLEVGIVDGNVATPGGFIETQDIEQELRKLVASARFTSDFDELPIPFRAVATDVVAGGMVVLERGDLATAMRASMAIPGAFSPVVIDDQVLVDGGLMRNLPVDVARELCADIVIAVWLTTPQPKAEEVSSALSIVGRSLDVVIRANERTQIEQLGPDDVGIEVAMNDIGTADFDRTPDAIALGRAAAEASRDTLARFVVSEAEYRAWRAGLEGASPPPQTLGAINIVGLGRVSEEFVEAQLQSSTVGGPVESEAIEDDAERIYALGDFERVEYRMSGPDDDRVLEILPVEKSWGPDYLRLNIGASTDSSADILGILRLDHTRTWVNARGGQWHSAVQIGGQSLLASDFYQPLDARHRFFVQPMAGLESSREDLYLDGDRIARYFVRVIYLQLDGGLNVGSKAQLRLGIRRGAYEVDRDTGLPTFPETDPSPDTSLRLRAIYDTRDSVSLPTRGAFASVRYIHAMDWLNGKEDYDLLEGVLQ